MTSKCDGLIWMMIPDWPKRHSTFIPSITLHSLDIYPCTFQDRSCHLGMSKFYLGTSYDCIAFWGWTQHLLGDNENISEFHMGGGRLFRIGAAPKSMTAAPKIVARVVRPAHKQVSDWQVILLLWSSDLFHDAVEPSQPCTQPKHSATRWSASAHLILAR